MTDLQCPATAVLLESGVEEPAWLDRLRIAEEFELREPADVGAFVEETADRFRGEAFVVRGPAVSVEQALRSRGIRGEAPVVVEIDSGGWTLRDP